MLDDTRKIINEVSSSFGRRHPDLLLIPEPDVLAAVSEGDQVLRRRAPGPLLLQPGHRDRGAHQGV